MDDSGNAAVTWAQAGATAQTAWTIRYTAGIGWGGPQALSTGTGAVDGTLDPVIYIHVALASGGFGVSAIH